MPQLVISTHHDPYTNIAVENYLLNHYGQGQVILYLWGNQRTVVIGQNQNPFAECNVQQLESDGGHLMRRRTGGGAVFHDLGNLNFSFIVPQEQYSTAKQFSVLQRTVATFGLQAEVSGRNDLLCQGRKFSGNAFARGGANRLHHGTILIKTDVEVLQRYLKVKPAKLQKHGVASVQSRVVNLSELNPAITAQSIVRPLIDAFVQEYGEPLEQVPFESLLAIPQVMQLRDSFASHEWKYGRWLQFQAQHSAQFSWGGVEVSVVVDEPSSTITSVQIASDSLFPDTIALAEQMLTGASTQQMPSFPATNEVSHQILSDICSLLYS